MAVVFIFAFNLNDNLLITPSIFNIVIERTYEH